MKRIVYALSSALLLALPWWGGPALSLLVAFIPLLLLQQDLADAQIKRGKLWLYVSLCFGVWWGVTTAWVGHAALIGAVLSVLFGGALCTAAFMVYDWVCRRAKRSLAYVVFVVAWISYEYLYITGEISFPWLTLGGGFAHDVVLVQWYEYTGMLGGSLWVLVSNLLFFEAIRARKSAGYWVGAVTSVLWPVAISVGMYWGWEAPQKEVIVQVIQPNLNPYTEKFNMGQDEQNGILLDLMRKAPTDVDIFLLPETAIDDQLWEGEEMRYSSSIQEFQGLLQVAYPRAVVVTGATTLRRYAPNRPSATSRMATDRSFAYDIYNSALAVDSSEVIELHHKSILVAGVEKMPYYEIFKHLDFLTVKLGGVTGQLGVDSIQKLFISPEGVPYSVAICYESIYGEYFARFVGQGAQVMFVITNDGWWGDTRGYHNHFDYSRLRAIETRRSLVRSANTGISGAINSRGEVDQTLGWDERGSLTVKAGVNDKITFYTRYGDYIGRLSWYIFALCMLYFFAYRIRQQSHINR